MKKWLMTAAILLASATAANAGLVRCETIRIFPGFSIQSCENMNRYERPVHYRNYWNKWGHKGYKNRVYAGNHYRYDRHYSAKKRYPPRKKYIRDRSYRRDYYRW